jgi:hypothetical protein
VRAVAHDIAVDAAGGNVDGDAGQAALSSRSSGVETIMSPILSLGQ